MTPNHVPEGSGPNHAEATLCAPGPRKDRGADRNRTGSGTTEWSSTATKALHPPPLAADAPGRYSATAGRRPRSPPGLCVAGGCPPLPGPAGRPRPGTERAAVRSESTRGSGVMDFGATQAVPGARHRTGTDTRRDRPRRGHRQRCSRPMDPQRPGEGVPCVRHPTGSDTRQVTGHARPTTAVQHDGRPAAPGEASCKAPRGAGRAAAGPCEAAPSPAARRGHTSGAVG